MPALLRSLIPWIVAAAMIAVLVAAARSTAPMVV
jgi:hypothetical protein